MAEEVRLVRRDVLDRLDPLAVLELDDAIDHQERIAVRQLLEDLVDVERHVCFFSNARTRSRKP